MDTSWLPRLDSNDSRYTAVDLFAGAGGMTLGLRQAGFDVVGAIEIDSLAAETYGLNHPKTRIVNSDIRNVDLDQFSARCIGDRPLDLLAACPPCQGFSTVRTRNRGATNDGRNRLIDEVVRFVDGLKPRTILFENVPGLVSNWRFAEFCRALRRREYEISFRVENAADYGVPQRRQRLLLVAALRFRIDLKAVTSTKRVTVRDAIGSSMHITKGDSLHHYTETRALRIRELIAQVPKDGGSRSDLPRSMQLACHRKITGFSDVYGRMRWDDVAPTITGGCINPSRGRFLHPDLNRAVTLREAAILQSFPPSYQFSLRKGRYAAAQMIGNALPPRVVARQARLLKRCLDSMAR